MVIPTFSEFQNGINTTNKNSSSSKIPTFSEFNNGTKTFTKNKVSNFPSFSEFNKNLPPKKKSLGSKVFDIGKGLVKAIASPVATIAARPIQAGAELLGAKVGNVNRVSNKLSGGLIAPVPQNSKDVLKDVGRGIETATFGLPTAELGIKAGDAILGASHLTPEALKLAKLGKPLATFGEGALFGTGMGLEEGKSPAGVLGSAAKVGAFTAALPLAFKGLGKIMPKSKASSVLDNVVGDTTGKAIDNTVSKGVKTTDKTIGEIKPIDLTASGGEKTLGGIKQPEVKPVEEHLVSQVKDFIKKNPNATAEDFVNAQMGKVETIKISDLRDRATAVGMKKSAFDKMSESIRKEGVKNPIIMNEDGVVIDGMRRAFVSQQIGLKEIPVIRVSNGLSLKEARNLSDNFLKTKSQLIEEFNKAKESIPKVSEKEYNKYREVSNKTIEQVKNYEDKLQARDPQYIRQSAQTRPNAVADYVAKNGIKDLFDVSRGAKALSPEDGFTAPFAQQWLINSGKLNNDQLARLLRSNAMSSFSGSSLQSVTPLESFMSQMNESVRKSFRRKIVANKKTAINLFKWLECK